MLRWILSAVLLLSALNVYAAERVVLLAPAAADIITRIGAEQVVVGVTKAVAGYPSAKRVGTHLRPNREIITSLRPDLIITTSEKVFAEEIATGIGADLIVFDPESVQEAIAGAEQIATLLGKKQAGEALSREMRSILKGLRPVKKGVKVAYEISDSPLTIAGAETFVADLIRHAGGEPYAPKGRNHVRFSPEQLLVAKNAYYLYQDGPMNPNPTPPKGRPELAALSGCIIRVNQLDFTRPNRRAFDALRTLNAILASGSCAEKIQLPQ